MTKKVKLTKDGVTISMPHMLGLQLDLLEQYMAYEESMTNAEKIVDKDEKNAAYLLCQKEFIAIVRKTQKCYPNYAEWSAEFSLIDHIKTFKSIAKGLHAVDISEELESDFLEE